MADSMDCVETVHEQLSRVRAELEEVKGERNTLLAACEVFVTEYAAYQADENQLYPERLLYEAQGAIFDAVAKVRGTPFPEES